MSYQTTRLARLPALYYRLDMVGAATDLDVVPDISGNALDGTVRYLNPHGTGPEPYGYASPIETDAASREFFGHAYNTSGDYEISRVFRVTDPLIEPSGDFTLDGWVRPANTTMGNELSDGTLKFNLFGKVGSCYIYIDHFKFLAGFMHDSAGNFYNVVCPTPFGPDNSLNDTSFYVALTRTGNSLALYINGVVVALTTVSSGLPTRDTGGDFRVFGDVVSGSPHGYECRYDEVAFQLDALGATDILTIYESAKAVNNMYATLTGSSSLTLDSTPPPVYAGFPYSHNFATPAIERLIRSTNVQLVRDGSEERTGRMTQTRRRLAYDILIPDASARRKFAAFMWANQYKPVAWPIIEDEAKLTVAVTAGDTTLASVDTDLKDYDVDGRFMISNGTDYELCEIASLGPLTTKQPIENDWPVGSKVVSCKRAYLEASQPITGITSEIQQANITAAILVEDIVESPNRITSHVATYNYRSIEVFDPFEWGTNDFGESQESDSLQEGETLDEQTGVFRFDADVTQSKVGIAYNLLLSGRAQISSFLGWFENRAGRLNKIWVPSLQEDLKLVSMTGSTITITDSDYADTYNINDARRDIALIKRDRTMAFRRINSVAQAAPNEVLTVDSSVSTLAATTRQVCLLRLCRLDADEIEITRLTGTVARVAFKFREILGES